MVQPNNQLVALVTGANRGIGLETARQLAKKGAIVFLSARRLQDSQEAVDQLKSEGISGAIPVQVDLTRAEDRLAVAKRISEECDALTFW